MNVAKMKKNDSKNQPHGFQYQLKVCLNIGAVWYGVVTLVCVNRFWSRFLLTLKRFTVVGP